MYLSFNARTSENAATKQNIVVLLCLSSGDVNMNMTGLYDMLIQMSEELRTTKQELKTMKTRQLETEKELNDTREILSIGNVIISEIEVEIRKVWTH